MSVTVMKMNLRGVYFEVNVDTLDRAKFSRLSRLSHGDEKVPLDSRGCYFYDRNPDLFHCILDYYHSGVLEIPQKFSWAQVKEELDFWEIEEKSLSESSRIRYTGEKEFEKKVHAVEVFDDRYAKLAGENGPQGVAAKTKGIWMFLEEPKHSKASFIFAIIFCLVIPYISVLNAFFHTLPRFSVFNYTSHGDEEAHLHHYHPTDIPGNKIILAVEIITKLAILIELILRFVSWPNKKKFFCDTLNWLDILSIALPSIHMTLNRRYINLYPDKVTPSVVALSHVLLAFITLRIFRVFRIWRCYDTYRIMMLAIKYTIPHFLLSFCVLRAFVDLLGFMVYATQAQLENTDFKSAFRGAWYASGVLITMGDPHIQPTGPFGRWLMSLSEGLAILMLAFPVVAFVNNYRLAYKVMNASRALHKRKELMTKENSAKGAV
jgi:hypothetical protein